MLKLSVDEHASAVIPALIVYPTPRENQPRVARPMMRAGTALRQSRTWSVARAPDALNTPPWWPTVAVWMTTPPAPCFPPASCSTWTTRSSTPGARRGSPGRRPPRWWHASTGWIGSRRCRRSWTLTAGTGGSRSGKTGGASTRPRRGSASPATRCNSLPGATTVFALGGAVRGAGPRQGAAAVRWRAGDARGAAAPRGGARPGHQWRGGESACQDRAGAAGGAVRPGGGGGRIRYRQAVTGGIRARAGGNRHPGGACVDGWRRPVPRTSAGGQAFGLHTVWVDSRAEGLPPNPAARPDRIVQAIAELLPG